MSKIAFILLKIMYKNLFKIIKKLNSYFWLLDKSQIAIPDCLLDFIKSQFDIPDSWLDITERQRWNLAVTQWKKKQHKKLPRWGQKICNK